jgi:hypothetical protein
MSTTNETKMWMGIVFSILISCASITFGVVQANVNRQYSRLEGKVELIDGRVNNLVTQAAVRDERDKTILLRLDEIQKAVKNLTEGR